MKLKIFIQHGYLLNNIALEVGTESVAWFWFFQFLPLLLLFLLHVTPQPLIIFKFNYVK